MSIVLKKRILISPEQKSAQLGAFFLELGFELSTEYNSAHNAEYLFVVDDYLPDLKFFPRIQTKKTIAAACLPDVRGCIDANQLANPNVLKLLSLYFSNTQSFDLVDRYSKDFKDVYNIKIHDYLNIGYFIDTIVVVAYQNKFDHEEIRNYLNSALPFALKELEKANDLAPLDVNFSFSDVGFALQIAFNAKGTNLKKELSTESSISKNLSDKANFFDVSYFSKRDRMILSTLWFKDDSLKSFKSRFFTEISNKSTATDSLINAIDENSNETQYSPVASVDSGNGDKVSKGAVEAQLDEFQRILGKKTPEDLAFMRISGGTEADNDDEWKVKSLGLAAKVQEEVFKIKGQGAGVEEEDLVRIISDQMGVDPKEAQTLIKGVMEEAIENMQVKKIQHDAHREKLESQVSRMKNVIEQMKLEIVKLRANAEVQKSPDDSLMVADQSSEVLDLKKALSKTLEAVRNKDKMSAKQKSDSEQIAAAKDEKISTLESRIEELKSEFSRSKEFANEEKLEQLQAENKSLNMRLELANRKINIISENMDKQDSGASIKKDKEISTLKSNIQMAQALIEKFKQERNEFEVKFNEEKEKSAKPGDSKGADNAIAEKDKQIIAIASEKKILEEKFRAQSIELKKQEQKLKFTIASLEESQRKRTSQPAQAAAKSNDVYIKQLENANARIADAANDLGEKKKEILKLKQENAVLSAKSAELEKKLGNIEKKAA